MNTSLLQIPQFNNKSIRHIFHEGKVYYSLVDIMRAVLDEYQDPSDYLTTLKRNDKQIPANCRKLKLPGVSGKLYPTDCSTEEEVYRVLQSVPSPNVEPFKQWLAKVAKERLDEERNPELAIKRARNSWLNQGKDEKWIESRMKGIAVRNELTKEWQERGAKGKDFAILTMSIHENAIGKTVTQHKSELKVNKNNLRDNLDELDLAILHISEIAARKFSQKNDSHGFKELNEDAKNGGRVGASAKKTFTDLLD